MRKNAGKQDRRITDIWCLTPLSIEDLATAFSLTDTQFDAENYWEWGIGKYIYPKRTVWLNISRSHHYPAAETETRIVIQQGKSLNFPNVMALQLVKQLQNCGVSPVYLGQWHYLQGNEFSLHPFDICWKTP